MRITAADYFSDPAKARLCDAVLAKAGIDPKLVPEITIDTDRARATIRRLALNEEGRSYLVHPDGRRVTPGGWREGASDESVIAMDGDVEIDWPHGSEIPVTDRFADEVEDDDETAHSDEHGVCVACGNCAICFDYDGGGCFDGSAHTVFEDLK